MIKKNLIKLIINLLFYYYILIMFLLYFILNNGNKANRTFTINKG